MAAYRRLRPLDDPRRYRGRRFDRATIRRAWGLARRWHGRLLGLLALIVVGAILSTIPPLFVRAVLDRAIPQGDAALLTWLFAGMLGVALLVAGTGLVQRWLSASIGEGFILDLRTRLYRHVQSMPLAFFTRTRTGALIARVNDDVIGAQRALTGTLSGVVDNAISVGVTLVVMAALQWQVTLVAVALLPLFVVPSRIVGRRLQQLTRESMAVNADMNTTMTERFGVAGALLVKLFGRADAEHERFASRAGRVADIGVRTAMHGRVLFVALGLVGSLASALVYLVGGRLAISGALEAGTVVALALYVTQLYGPLAQLANARVDLMTALVSFERVFEVLDLDVAITDAPDAVELVEPAGHVRFADVSFAYPAAVTLASLERDADDAGAALDGVEVDVLSDIDLDLPPGTMLALVGSSGAGKSTLASLVPRLYDVSSGRVTIDGHDVRDVTLRSLSDAVGVVTQDPHLFHVSVAENLRYARPDATDDELRSACRVARILDVVEALPDGFDTIVGERGYRLSGGEKQRLALARVVLKDPRVVVLDEATAHLDTTSERLVQAALADVLVERTSIVIAHRLSTVVDADRIVVLEAGRIVEQGTHDELLRRDGRYAELARTQLVTA